MRVAVFGLGYVGTVTAAGLAAQGHDVYGVDVDTEKVAAIAAGRSPVVEPGLDELMADVVAAGRLHATTSPREALAGADVSLVCVGTPSTPYGGADLTYVERALADIAAALRSLPEPESRFHSVVIRSTVPPGTGDTVVAPAFAGPVGEWTVGTAMCPEFLREGSGLADFAAPPLLVLGTADDRVAAAIATMFGFLDMPLRVVSVRSAEALKYTCNAFHATKVAFTNEMARILRLVDVDAREVMDAFCDDTVLNVSSAYLRPGFAFGGSCLPKDLRSLLHIARSHNVDAPTLAGVSASNDLVVRDLVDRIIATGERSVAVLGLSFKSNTDDLRESPNVEVAERLIGKGFDVRIYDPIINPDRLVGANRRHVEARLPHLSRLLARSAGEALEGAAVAVAASTAPAVVAALLKAPPKRLFDLSGRLGDQVEQLPCYEGIGW